ncbi:hypothetical protein SCHPADRAFT_262414 [Schizopora paradoxa]|uniref:Uncharacterized protein n=1 Tax=Schizopora paradoxa TaxID=27342 RepID=A0A0H2S137_9AGAM|nr:hypothetical protein SCHPADRAFT_262414 [Schizopora paradoxa]
MARRLQKPHFWTSHQSIEAYCAHQTELLLKYRDELFEEMEKAVQDEYDRGLAAEGHIEAKRQGMDKTKMLVHLKNMQLEVIRRAMSSTRGDLDALTKERADLLSQIGDTLASRSLPTLPDETITHIFSYLYWMEDYSFLDDHPWGRNPDSGIKTTLRRLLDDVGTPSGWKDIIYRQIPIVLVAKSKDVDYVRAVPGLRNLVGAHPTIHLMHEPKDEELMRRPSTTILVDTSDFSEAVKGLESVREFPWRNLIFFTGTRVRGEGVGEMMEVFMKNYAFKFADLITLEFPYSGCYNESDLNLGAFLRGCTEAHSQAQAEFLTCSLKTVRAPILLLPGLRPFLSNITVLEAGISLAKDSAQRSVSNLLECLQPCSHSLSNLTVTIVAPNYRPDGSQQDTTDTGGRRKGNLTLPHLKQLRFEAVPNRIVEDILSSTNIPSLSHLSFTRCNAVFGGNQFDGSPFISTVLLHESFPTLESISFGYWDGRQYAKFFSSLASPDANGTWLLPRLDAIQFGLDHDVAEMLEALTKAVKNRLADCATKSIRSISMSKVTPMGLPFYGNEEHVEPLKLIVPELITRVDEERRSTW